MSTVALLLLSLLVATIGVVWFLVHRSRQRQKAHDERAATLFKPTRGGLARETLAALQQAHHHDGDVVIGSDDDEEVVADAGLGELGGGDEGRLVDDGRNNGAAAARAQALSRLQKKKQAKQEEKENRRVALAAAQEQRAKDAETKELAEKEATEAAARKEAEEDAAVAQLRREKKQREDAEYQQWVGTVGLDSKGELGSQDEQQASIHRYLSAEAPLASKILLLDDAARRLHVSVDVIVKHLENLVSQEKVRGVFDDRGKFVYVSADEYDGVARFLRNRGRVSLTELVREANRLVGEDVARSGNVVAEGSRTIK